MRRGRDKAAREVSSFQQAPYKQKSNPFQPMSIFNVGSCVPRAPTNNRTISIVFVELSYSQSEKTSNFFSVLDLQFILYLY